MSFNSRETSAQDGRPGFLYEFYRTGITWRYTNLETPITFLGNVYTPVAISIGSVLQSGDAASDDLSITIATDAPLCTYLDTITPSEEIQIRLRKIHIDEAVANVVTGPALIGDAPVHWNGSILTIKRTKLNERVFVCNTSQITLARGGLRLSWARNCPHVLYGRGCNVNRNSFLVTLAFITIVDAITIAHTSLALSPDGYFSGGFIEWESLAGVTERMGISTHIGDTITLQGLTSPLSTGDTVASFPGCARIASVCSEKFNNMVNYGGINHLQGKSPFDGNPVF